MDWKTNTISLQRDRLGTGNEPVPLSTAEWVKMKSFPLWKVKLYAVEFVVFQQQVPVDARRDAKPPQ